MIKVENLYVDEAAFEVAVRGMRNPMNSWERSDSEWMQVNQHKKLFDIGENDLKLMRKLFDSGPEHRKYLRFVNVSMDITAPLYWWKEFDTYKIGTVCNSCSTMHKIHERAFTIDDFSHDKMSKYTLQCLYSVITELNDIRTLYLESKKKNKQHWWDMIQLLPASYNQRRTIQMNYETVVNIIHQRSGHKLDEWGTFVKILKTKLPYLKEITE